MDAARRQAVLRQSYADVQVIVAGSSSDVFPDPRVRFAPLAAPAGRGPAWAAGYDAAEGEYCWFVDAGGRVADGALTAIAERLRALQPDLLLVGHHGPPWTDVAPGQMPAPGVFTVADRPDAFATTPAAWARVVRRDLVARAAFPFHPGRYADVPFSYPLLVAAERIAVLDRVCYHSSSSTTPPGGDSEFEVFDQYERLYTLLDRWGVDGREARDRGHVRARIAERMMAHYRTAGERLRHAVRPREGNGRTQRAFFGQLSRAAGWPLAWPNMDGDRTSRPPSHLCAATTARCTKCWTGLVAEDGSST